MGSRCEFAFGEFSLRNGERGADDATGSFPLWIGIPLKCIDECSDLRTLPRLSLNPSSRCEERVDAGTLSPLTMVIRNSRVTFIITILCGFGAAFRRHGIGTQQSDQLLQ